MDKSKNISLLANKHAFTLAEVLITLGIIGVVVSLTIPTILGKIQDEEYKTSYKKAYSAISQALQRASHDELTVPLTGEYGRYGAEENFAAMKNYFIITKECSQAQNGCWDIAGEHFRGDSYTVPAFIDNSGMAWKLRKLDSMIGFPVVLVDTNGLKKPNKYGQDRFPFLFNQLAMGSGPLGMPTRIVPYYDFVANDVDGSCPSAAEHPCYNTSWLINKK